MTLQAVVQSACHGGICSILSSTGSCVLNTGHCGALTIVGAFLTHRTRKNVSEWTAGRAINENKKTLTEPENHQKQLHRDAGKRRPYDMSHKHTHTHTHTHTKLHHHKTKGQRTPLWEHQKRKLPRGIEPKRLGTSQWSTTKVANKR